MRGPQALRNLSKATQSPTDPALHSPPRYLNPDLGPDPAPEHLTCADMWPAPSRLAPVRVEAARGSVQEAFDGHTRFRP